ncbi:MAG: hypothetical protein LBL72_09935 [Candidatus Accumulibacter sp.]|nr:hypothetical protein [Accumulibacter sp.]
MPPQNPPNRPLPPPPPQRLRQATRRNLPKHPLQRRARLELPRLRRQEHPHRHPLLRQHPRPQPKRRRPHRQRPPPTPRSLPKLQRPLPEDPPPQPPPRRSKQSFVRGSRFQAALEQGNALA